MESNQESYKVKRLKKKNIYIFGIIFILLAGSSTFGYYYHSAQVEKQEKIHAAKVKAKKEAEAQYKKKMRNFYYEVSSAKSKSEEIINQYKIIWNDTIFNNYFTTSDGDLVASSDFNEAIETQKYLYELNGTLKNLDTKTGIVYNYTEKLKNPPAKYKDIYSRILDIYATLVTYKKFADNPSGSLQTYSTQSSEINNTLTQKINEYEMRIN
jgi:hypothetical protein